MSYQVLARKWRPAVFEELVGQEHVVQAIVNALDNDRLHHAYLFTGTRGVGKTTIARILSRCLNCEQGVSAKPCGECSACQQHNQGSFIDLIEVDAASRTKVEDTREMLENVQYTPTSGRYKVYLIDEVHMLSKHSFNALLKTLEEPPPHVKFLLATTDPQKLPVTVLSRCLQFNLKRVPVDLIAAHMTKIMAAEDVIAEAAAIDRLAYAADGSIRDGLSLLDQAISYGNGELKDAEVGKMLGSIARDHLLKLMQGVSNQSAQDVMAAIEELADMAPDYAVVLDDLISLMHNFAVVNALPDIEGERFGDMTPELMTLARDFSAEELQLYYEIVVRARRDLPIVPNRRHALEMAMLRMLAFGLVEEDTVLAAVDAGAPKVDVAKARRTPATINKKPDDVDQQTRIDESAKTDTKAEEVKAGHSRPDVSHSEPAAVRQPEASPQASPVSMSEPQPAQIPANSSDRTADHDVKLITDQDFNDWSALIERLPLVGMAKALASHSSFVGISETTLTLALGSSDSTFLTEKSQENLTTTVSDLLGRNIILSFDSVAEVKDSPAEQARLAEEARDHRANASINSDPIVENITNTFDATIIPGSINPE